VEAFYLFRVRDLDIVRSWAEEVKRRHDIEVRMYPHFDLSRCYRHAVMQPHWAGLGKRVPRIAMKDIERIFRRDANVWWLAYGWRRNDSLSRALIMKKCAGYDAVAGRVFPLRSWRRRDVYAYLENRNIPAPPNLGRKDQGGLDFNPGALRELQEKWPEDYRRWLTDFPFSAIQSMHPTSSIGHGKESA
jgi:phosphoadenosine phosphosulfate reductase